ncbi:hypothetical protein CP974_24745 [Streptomyces fradiae ATCC 10745 = DSM 40063]|nr:hypothetical protein CP974_24745 [Streptomyces fradiae ATCC 10745 = DSM 40063]
MAYLRWCFGSHRGHLSVGNAPGGDRPGPRSGGVGGPGGPARPVVGCGRGRCGPQPAGRGEPAGRPARRARPRGGAGPSGGACPPSGGAGPRPWGRGPVRGAVSARGWRP